MIVLATRVHNSVQLCKRSSVVLWHPILTLDQCWMCALSCRVECKRSSGRQGSLGTGLYLMGMLTRGYPLLCPVHAEHWWHLSIWVEMIAFDLLSKLSSPKIHKGPRVSVSSVYVACWQETKVITGNLPWAAPWDSHFAKFAIPRASTWGWWEQTVPSNAWIPCSSFNFICSLSDPHILWFIFRRYWKMNELNLITTQKSSAFKLAHQCLLEKPKKGTKKDKEKGVKRSLAQRYKITISTQIGTGSSHHL